MGRTEDTNLQPNMNDSDIFIGDEEDSFYNTETAKDKKKIEINRRNRTGDHSIVEEKSIFRLF